MNRQAQFLIDPERQIRLTAKEAMFLSLCCQDIPHTEIAYIMAISVRTADGYRDSLFKKIGVRSRVSLILYCFKLGLIKARDVEIDFLRPKFSRKSKTSRRNRRSQNT